MPCNIDIRLLGTVDVQRDGQTVSLGGRRQRALLTLLAVEPGRVVSADRIIDELWAGEPPPAAEATLRTYVSRLRRVLGVDAVVAKAGGICIAGRRHRESKVMQ